MSASSGKFRVSTFQLSCGLSSSAVLGVWQEGSRAEATSLSSSPRAPSSMPHREGDCYLQNAVLLRHCKSGALHDAVSFFDKMAKDLYSWNIMMSMYNRAQDGGGKVLALFDQMQQEATIPNAFILASIISACTTHGDVRPGKLIHARISQAQGLCLDVVLQSALINMYGRFGELKVARQLFSDNPLPDTALWNGTLTIYSQNGIDVDCLILYNHMQQLCIMQNNITYVLMLSVCSKVTSLTEGKKLHTRIVAVGCETDIMVGTALINMYSKCGQVDNANDIFGRMQERDIILWNAVIAGYSLNMKHKEVYQLYAQMEQEGAMPNEATYTCILDACSSSSEGKQVHACIIGRSLGLDVVADAALLKMYGKCGGVDEAHRYFKETKHHDIVAWNTMISTFAKEGMNMQALQLYDEMMKEGIVPDGVTFVTILSTFMSEAEFEEGKLVHRHIVYLGLDLETGVTNALINMYGKCSTSLHDAMAIFNKLRDRDSVTFVSIISACSSQAIFAQGQYIHTLIKEEKIESNTILANAIMSMYSKSGYLSDARKVFEEMQEQKTVVSWSTIIATYGQHGEGKEVLYLHDQMQRSGIELETITSVSLLFAFSQAGLLDEGCRSFSFIVGKQQLVSLDHFNCMIDLLGRIGCLDDAMCLICGMPFQPSNMSWSILVCASQLHMHFDRGELTSEYVLELNPDDTTGYVVLSNIYNAQCIDITVTC